MFDFILNNEFLKIFFMSMIPIGELRVSIPYFIAKGIIWQKVLTVSIIGNIFIGVLVLYVIAPIMFYLKKNRYFYKIINYILIRTRSKSSIINNYKLIGLIVFVGIPFPLTGVWTGALASYLFSISRKRAIIGITLGVIISSFIMLFITFVGKKVLF